MGEDKRKRYQIICPYCGKLQYAEKSIFHELGMSEAGHGVCLKCIGAMRLVFHEQTDTMTAEKWKSAKKRNAGNFFD